MQAKNEKDVNEAFEDLIEDVWLDNLKGFFY
jgi:hypothetical protein